MDSKKYTIKQTKELARKLAHEVKGNTLFLLSGDLGSGKTTFTRYFVQALGFGDRVQSPTFVIHKKYAKQGQRKDIKYINHIDLYRLQDSDSLEDLDLEQVLEVEGAVTLIEWPEIAGELFDRYNPIRLNFEYLNDEERTINVQN